MQTLCEFLVKQHVTGDGFLSDNEINNLLDKPYYYNNVKIYISKSKCEDWENLNFDTNAYCAMQYAN